MANEFKHDSVGPSLTEAEWIGIGTHVLDSQATGDIIYASSASQLRRLAVGSNTNVLTLAGGVPTWAVVVAPAGTLTGSTLASGVTASSLTSVGTLTDLTVSGTSTTIGTVTSGIWNAGAVTSSGAVTGTSLDVNGNADISGDLTLSAGADGALSFSVASSIKILDNSATSLVIEEANNAYLTFVTTDNAEKITTNVPIEVLFDSSPADLTSSGITATFTAGEALERGEVVYFKASDSKMWKAVATASATSRCVAMAANDIAADAAGLFLLQGFLQDTGTFPSYTVSGLLYTPEAETTSQNVPEQTAPDTDGDFIQIIGWAVTADIVYFKPDSTVIEHA